MFAENAPEEIERWRHQATSPSRQLDWRWIERYRDLDAYDAFWWWAQAGPFNEEEQQRWDHLYRPALDEAPKEQLGGLIAQSRQRELAAAIAEQREPNLHYPALDIKEVRVRIAGLLHLDGEISQQEPNAIVRRLYRGALEELRDMDYPHFLAAFLEAHNLKPLDDEIADLQFHNVGNLVVTSGKLLACDPYYCSEVEPFEAALIPPGQYPVILAVACLRNGDQRVAIAALQFRNVTPARWEIALPSGWRPVRGPRYTYCVDSAIGCFMDADAVSAFAPVCEDYDAETDPILTAMGKNHSHASASWADVCVKQDTRTNIIAFTSGWGDGGYPSFFGYDENENIACLVKAGQYPG